MHTRAPSPLYGCHPPSPTPPGVGPEHAFLKDSGRAAYVSVTDTQALEALQTLSRTEGIIPALEPSHAIYHAMQVRRSSPAHASSRVSRCARRCHATFLFSRRHPRRLAPRPPQVARASSKDTIILVNMCGRGDKDMSTVAEALHVDLTDGGALAATMAAEAAVEKPAHA